MASSRINIDLVLNTKGFRPLGRINGQLGEFEKSLDASNARVLAFGASAGAILAVKKAFTATVKAAIDVEKSLTDINVILRATSSGLKKFGSELFSIASQTGQSFAVAAEAAGELARQGLGLNETLKRTRDALILSRLAGMDAVEAVNALTAAMNTFNQAGLDSTVIINKLANVDAAFAVSSDDLAKALGRVGASAKGAGVSFDELLAIVTVAQQKTARGGAVIGNSFKTIFTRIQRPKVISALEDLGVAVRDVTGDVFPAMKVLNNLAKTFDVLTSSQKSAITELVGGVFQVNILKAAMSDLSAETGIYGRALSVANDSTDQALRRNEELNKTLSAQFNKTLNTFKEAAAELGTLTMGPTLENLFASVEKIETMGKTPMGKVGTGIAKSIFEGIGKFISGPGLLVVGLVLFKTFSQLGKFAADAFKTLTGLNKNLQNQMSLQRQIFDVLSENPDLMKKIEDGTISVEEAHEEIYKQIEKNTGALDKQLMVSDALAKSIGGAGVMFSPDFGATTGGARDYGGKKGKSFGYVPNFIKDRDELMGMAAGGYSRHQIGSAGIKETTVHDGSGGSSRATINRHESVVNTKNQDGKRATFVVPPKGTDAYKQYMSALSGGFIPNFNNAKFGSRISRSRRGELKPGDPNYLELEDAIRQGYTGSLGKSVKPKGNLTNKQFKKQHISDSLREDKEGKAWGKGYKDYEVGGKYGIYSLIGKSENYGAASASTASITAFKGTNKEERPKGIHLFGIQYKTALGKQPGKAGAKNKYSDMIRDQLGKPFMNMSADFANEHMGIPSKTAAVAAGLKKGGPALFPVGAEGSMFEATVNAVTQDKELFDQGLRANENEAFDFRGGGSMKKFKKYTGFTSSLDFADAKRTNDKKSRNSLVNKIFNQALNDGGKKPQFIEDLEQLRANKVSTTAKKKATKALGYVPNFNMLEGYPEDSDSLSRGFIPNFNALWESARRERSGGIPAAKIRVGRSDRLKNGSNPGGYGIYNTRDEPMGLNQGINDSMSAGIDPKKKGMARGFIPNFAKKGGGSLEAALGKNTAATRQGMDQGMKTMVAMGIVSQVASALDNSIGENSTVLKSLSGTLSKMAMTFMAVKYAVDSLSDSMGLKGKDRDLLGGKKSEERVASEGEFFKKKRADANKSYKEEMTRAREIDKKAGFKRSDTRAGRGTAESQKIQKGARRKRARSDIMYGKGAGRGPLGASGKGGGMMGGLMKGGIGRLAGGAGLAYGAMKGIGNAATKTDLSSTFKEQRLAAKAYEKIAAETEKNIGHLTQYGQAAQRAADVLNDTNSSVGQVMLANQKLADAMKELPSKFKNLVAGQFDVGKIQAAIEVATEAQQKEQSNAQARTDAASTLERNRDSTGFDFMASPLASTMNWISTIGTEGGANIKGQTDEERKFSSKENVKQGEQVVTRLNQDSLRKADLQRTFMETAAEGTDTEADRMTQADIVSKGLRMSDEDAAITMKQAKVGGDSWDEFLKGLQEAAVQDQANLRIAREMAPALKAMQVAVKKEEMAVRDHAEALKREQTVRHEVLKITSQAAGEFLTSVGKISLATDTKKIEAKQAISEKFAGQTLNVRTARAKASEAFTATDEMGALGADIEAILTKAETKGVGNVDEKDANAAVEEVGKRIQELKDIAADQDTSALDKRDAKTQQKQLETLEAVLVDLHVNSEKGLKEQVAAVDGIDKMAEAQKLAARQARRLKSFGGGAALLDPSKLNPMLKQIRGGRQAQIAAQRGGSQMGMDRGRLNELKGMQDMFGGELPKEMKAQGVKLAEKVALVQMKALNKQTGGKMDDEFIAKAAKEQAAQMFKGNPMDENTKALESNTAALEAQKGIEKASREDPASIGRMSAKAGSNKDTATKNIREMLATETAGRTGFADSINEDTKAITDSVGSGAKQAYGLENRSAIRHGAKRELQDERNITTAGGEMVGRPGQRRFEGGTGPMRTIKRTRYGLDSLAADDVSQSHVVFNPEGQAMDLGQQPRANANPYGQAQHGRAGGQSEDVARFSSGGMFDPTFSQSSAPSGSSPASSSSTTNNNTAEVHFNISSEGHVQVKGSGTSDIPGSDNKFYISRGEWENIDKAVAEGKRRSDAIIKSIEGSPAGDKFLKTNIPDVADRPSGQAAGGAMR